MRSALHGALQFSRWRRPATDLAIRRCGVLAILDTSESFVHREEAVRDICSLMIGRGPDGQGFAAGQVENGAFHWTLAHQRLAIMDPHPRGNQPMLSADGKVKLVANGELYNFRKLYKGLLGNPETFSDSDSEVILHLWKHFVDKEGLSPNDAARKICESLDGMFAFVVIDEERNTYCAGRDPHGIKPLYMGIAGDKQRMFASELKCLVNQGFDEIVEIPPGHFYSPDGGLQRYYEPAWLFDPKHTFDPSITPKDVRDALEAAVVKRMMSDVDFGLFLSGGVDSCIVATLMRPHVEAHGGRIPSFTVGQEGSPDVVAARAIAEHLGYEHSERLFTAEEAFSIVEKVVYHLETYEPELIRSAIPNYFLAEHTSKHVKMVLTGEGADELFAGYVYFEDAPNSAALQGELKRIFQALGNVNLKRTDRMTMAHGLEARVPFLDTEFAKLVMGLDPELKMIHDRDQRREKAYLRKIFTGELPHEVLWRQKAMQCEGVGEGWVSQLQRWCAEKVSDEAFAKAAERFPLNPPQTKEEYFYRDIFDYHYHGMEKFVHVWEGGMRAGGASWKSSAYTREGLADTSRLTHALQGSAPGKPPARGFASAVPDFSTPLSPSSIAALTEDILVSNCDDRTTLDPATGRNMYHAGPFPAPPGAVVRSSCTCSPVTQHVMQTFLESPDLVEDIATASASSDLDDVMADLRERVSNAFDLPPSTAVVLCASGTDAELVPLALAKELKPEAKQVRAVITAKKEIGRGVVQAAAGQYFNHLTPLGGALDDRATGEAPADLRSQVSATTVELRDAKGTLLDATEECTRAVLDAQEANEVVVVHSVQGTKTNARDPFPPVSSEMLRQAGVKAKLNSDYVVVVDGCQGRLTNAEIRKFLDDGAIVLLTGSKFFQGPPFSGAVLVPGEISEAVGKNAGKVQLPDIMSEFFSKVDIPEELGHWKNQLPDVANRGTALRWLGAMAEIEAYQQAGSVADKDAACSQWREAVVASINATEHLRVFEANDTIINFAVEPAPGEALGMDDLKKLYLWLTLDLTDCLAQAGVSLSPQDAKVAATPCLIGQPVDVAADFGIVRIALGAADVRAALRGEQDRVLEDDATVVAKANLVAKYFDVLASKL
eukprot:CAMPEP_0118977050 /NCGR_PEP_ID=MMETSP1173-20130426/20398_1 /TAXON_ID=1034831 /ORGANISM="Rhizochromulina marina cf, Strain CCMP1243" /LENGTH=1116 /DNA_ID=CAMNT_0006927123 /DNA_START=148 /DNA_END=3498 /DNA_ORIENTATION=-